VESSNTFDGARSATLGCVRKRNSRRREKLGGRRKSFRRVREEREEREKRPVLPYFLSRRLREKLGSVRTLSSVRGSTRLQRSSR
jgi:hypothetical protein